jgi:hypothetical protein
MLKRNPKLNVDTSYKKYRPLRKLNFSFGIKLDSSFYFNGFSSGIKYSLIDERDATTSEILFSKFKNNSFNVERKTLGDNLKNYKDSAFPNAGNPDSEDFKKKKKFTKNLNKLFQENTPLNKLDNDFQKIVKDIIAHKSLKQIDSLILADPSISFKEVNTKILDTLKNSIKKNWLWTIGINDTTYKDKFEVSNVAIVSEVSKGVFNPKPGANNFELNIKAGYNFSNDTLQKDRNLKRRIFSFEPGLNWVIRDKEDRSFFELKLSGSYYHNFSSLYKDEERNKITLNGTERIRVYEDIWIPLEIKYDPKNGNVFGFLNVKANFTGLGKLLKAAKA